MRSASVYGVLLLALALASCRDDSTSAPVSPTLLASRHVAEDPPQFSAWSTPVNLGPPLNTPFIDQGTSVSKDGLSLYFHCGNCPGNVGGADIYVSQRASRDEAWGPPQRLGPNINTAANEQAPRLSRDGHRLFFHSDRAGGIGGQDIYVSLRRDKRDDFGWEPAVNLGGGVNTTVDDLTPDPFEDNATGGDALFFARGPAGSGGTDIYASPLLANGTYGPGVPVAELNTSSLDRQPAIRRDGLEIFFASDRDGPPGNLDLFVATRRTTSDPWSTPVNLGPTVNTLLVDARPALSFDGTTLYFQSTRPGNVGCTSSTGPCVFDIWITTRTELHRTVLVNPHASGDGIASTIQAGIDMVVPGGQVHVAPGTYNEALVINKGLTLDAGDDGQGVAIVAPALGPDAAIEIGTTDPVAVRGLKVEYVGSVGIRGIGPVELTIARATILGPSHGGVVVINDAGPGRARLSVRESRIEGPTADPRVNQQSGISAFGDVDASIERNVVRVGGAACIMVLTRLDLAGETNGQILDNDVDACGEAGGIRIGRRGPAPTGPPATATGGVDIIGNVIRNTPGSCVSRTGINIETLGRRIERNSIVGYVQACAGPGPRALPGAIWVGSIAVIHPQVTPVVRFNDISGNAQAGLHLGPNQAVPIDVSCNWWGSANGPAGAGPGTGDPIVIETGAATPVFTPFATAPIAERGGRDGEDDDAHAGRTSCPRDQWSEPVNLGPTVNASGADFSPTLSPDLLSLYFGSDRPHGVGGIDIWVSHRACVHCPWGTPTNLGPTVNSAANDNGPSFSLDGRLLFFSSNRPGGAGLTDIWVSHRADPRDDGGWEAPLDLGSDVNTAATEAGPEYVQPPGARTATLYFNRAPAGGTFDIYQAPLTLAGATRGPAVLVAELSHPTATDQGPSLSTDGREILFFSTRPGGFGGTDLWTSTRARLSDAWSAPVNLGTPLNTTALDQQPSLSGDGRTLVFASDRPGGQGGFDIWTSTRSGGGHDDADDGNAGRRTGRRTKGR